MIDETKYLKEILDIVQMQLDNYNIGVEQKDDDLAEYGLNSIIFIRIIVTIEEAFSCEIPDSKLIMSEMNTVGKIINTLNSIL